MHSKTLFALLGILIGVTCGELFLYGSEIAVLSCLLGVAQLTLYFFESRSKKKSAHHTLRDTTPRAFTLSLVSGIFFLCLAIGILRVQFSEEKGSFVCNESCTFDGVIIDTPRIKGVYQVLAVQPITDDDVYNVEVKAPLYPRLQEGEKITLSGKVTAPHTTMAHTGMRTFDYASYLRLHALGSEMIYPKIEVHTESVEVGMVSHLKRMKENFLAMISLYVNEPSASLAKGMLFGDSSMSEELVQTFRVAGLSHIIVLSGFNIAILITSILLVLMFVPLVVRVVLASVFVILFVLMVGGEVSIIRATLMSFVSLLALLFGRAYTARQALLLSLLIIVLFEPFHLLHDVSLHLSFLATAGIIYMSEGVKKLFTKVHSETYKEIITTTLCAYIATLPYVMYTFGTVSLYALLANIIVLPLVPLTMLVTFLIVVTAPISHFLGFVFGYVTTLLGEGIIFVARSVEQLPLSSLQVSLSLRMMSFIYVLIGISFTLLITRRKNETRETKNEEIFSEVISF